MSPDLTGERSTLVQVMAWCRKATSHYLSQYGHRSMTSLGHIELTQLLQLCAGVGVTKHISSVPLFSELFSIFKTRFGYWMSRLYLTGVTKAELRWHLSNITVIKRSKRYFCKIENFAYGEINERSFSNPTPGLDSFYLQEIVTPYVE